jgi:hypothetical protein
MNIAHAISVPAEVMTWRARAYLVITAVQHGLIGFACIWLSGTEAFSGDAFRIIRHIFPIWGWGVVFVAGGIHLAIAAGRGSELLARVAMPLSAVLTSLWAMAFILAWHEGGVVSPVGAILATSLTAKDLVICRQPMRSPFEPLVKEYAGPRGS